jgi:putative intracellular protease/amidase
MKPHYIVRLLLMIACSCALGAITTTMGQSAPSAAQKQPTAKTNVAIFIFDGVQIIDYAGPYEVFGGARFNVYTVAPQKQPITTIYGMKVTPDYDFSNHPKPDILVIPGGGRSSANPSPWKPGLPVEDDPRIFKWVQDTAAQSQYVLSVCNGAFTLARTGLLNGLSATTTMPFLARLKEVAPRTKVITDKRWVDNGKIVISGCQWRTSVSISVPRDRVWAIVDDISLIPQYHPEVTARPTNGIQRTALRDDADAEL